MTVSTAYSVLSYAGNDATTAFAVTWPFLTGSLVVTLVDEDGVETVKALGTHYTVSGGTDSNGLPAVGTVTMITAPATGETLRITRSTAKTQATTWTESDGFPQKTVEAMADKLTLLVQEAAAASGNLLDEVEGDVLSLVTSGATDYWDAESHIIRNVSDPTAATDAVNYQTLQQYALDTGVGDVVGPASATDNAIARFDGTTGNLIQNSVVTISDAGIMAGVTAIELGDTAGANTPYIDLRSSGNAVDYDSRLIASGGDATLGGGVLSFYGTYAIVPRAASLKQGLSITQSGAGDNAGAEFNFNLINVTGDVVDAGSAFVSAAAVSHTFGGSATEGGREAFSVQLNLDAVTNASNANRNYGGGSFTVVANTGDGGGSGTEKGALFGLAAFANTKSGATFLTNVTGGEINIAMETGSSSLYKSLLQLAGHANDAVQGSTYDCMLALSNQANTVLWEDGILFGAMNGYFPIDTSGTLIRTISGSFTDGIDLSTSTISGWAWQSPSFNVNGSGGVVRGHSALVAVASVTPALQTHGLTAANSSFSNARWSADTGGAFNYLAKSRGATVGSHAVVNSGDSIGGLVFVASDGTGFITAANITGEVDGTPGTNDMPGRLVFRTTADGASSPTEHMRIDSVGVIAASATATPAGGSTAARLRLGTTAAFGIHYGSGAPTVSAAQGSLYLRSDGSSTSTRAYINTDGGTTWTAVTTAA